jgi:branched-chain amino acid transport system ATP-binding protein
MASILELVGVSKYFGGLMALKDVSFELHPGEIVGLIGPNGAGKTTLVNVITGVYPLSGGKIVFNQQRIDRLKPHNIARMGIARTFQIVQPFPQMTVLENVAAGVLFAAGAQNVQEAKEHALDHLNFIGLQRYAEYPASSLTLADRKRLELAKSLAMNPRLLLLDEVNAGLNPTEIDRALGLIRQLITRGITILLIEHLMKVVMSVCSRVIVLHHGQLIAEGSPEDVVKDQRVIEAYLGSRFAAREQR